MPKIYNPDNFFNSAKEKHKSKYKYNKVVYKNSKSKVIITCPIHGDFEQTPKNHLSGCGCPRCAGRISSTKELIEDFKKVHNNRYDYSKVHYTTKANKVIIICKNHGEFLQVAQDHLKGHNCPKCSIDDSRERKSSEEYITQCSLKHNNKYDYSKVKYTHSKLKVVITCPIHGDFEQVAGIHLHGQGCPKCAKSGFNPNKPAYLYYLKIIIDEENVLYKIGITNRTVHKRYSKSDLKKIVVLNEQYYEYGKDALNLESYIKQKFKEYAYKGVKVLESGNTEIFTINLLDKEKLFN